MPNSHTPTATRNDWLSKRWSVPSWLASLGLHGLLLVICSHFLQFSADRPPVGFGDTPFQTVGIVLKQPNPGQSLSPNTTPNPQPNVDPQTTTENARSTSATAPPVLPQLAEDNSQSLGTGSQSPLIGIGTTPPLPSNMQNADIIKPSGAVALPTPGDNPSRGTTFMGIQDQGQKVVFVIDCSGSMSRHHAMRVAKTALVSSLNQLHSDQKFQVVFYNEFPTTLKLGNESRANLYSATPTNLALARQQIAAITPDLGTEHLPALRAAFKFDPDIIYLLTDADTDLDARDRAEVSKLNQKKAHIHSIEFGRGPEVKIDNFLKRLSREANGSYRYFDITRFNAD